MGEKNLEKNGLTYENGYWRIKIN